MVCYPAAPRKVNTESRKGGKREFGFFLVIVHSIACEPCPLLLDDSQSHMKNDVQLG